MKTVTIRKPGQRPYLELHVGSCYAKLYSCPRQKNGRTYQEHVLTYSFAGQRVRRTFADSDDAILAD